MALTEKQYTEIMAQVESSTKPLFFFHDDPDGLASFLLLYRAINRGKGVVVKKSTPSVGVDFLRKVQEYGPDRIFVLDVAIVEQEFIDNAGAPVVWIDHHEPLARKDILYFNPRASRMEDNDPVSLICYRAVKRDEWIAAAGVVGDWFVPDFLDKLEERYPELVDKNAKTAGELLFETKLGKLSKIFSFILKGRNEDILQSVKVLTRIEDPKEILEQSTSRGRLLFKRYSYVNKPYEKLLETAKKAKNDKMLVFVYKHQTSFTGDLSNELLYLFPDSVIVVGRERQDAIKLSLRGRKVRIVDALKKALQDVGGYGGGHEYACGAVVSTTLFPEFIEKLKKNLKL